MTPAVQFDRVTLTLGRHIALADFDLTVSPGSFTAILGPNGAGKSTLLRACNGELPATSGNIITLGKHLGTLGWRDAANLRRRIGIMHQQTGLGGSIPLSVREVVEIARAAHSHLGAPLSSTDYDICAHWLDRFGLTAIANRPFTQLSGGQQRKVHLARIFAQQPELILLDEPAGHLDLAAQDSLTRLVADVWREEKATVILVTHELRHLPPDTSRVILLSHGKVIADGAPAATLTSQRLSDLFEEPLKVFEHQGRYATVPHGEGGGNGRP